MKHFITLLCVALLAVAAHSASAEDGLSDEQLDQMLAPIALYPDSLLSQVLMACSYPADVAAAAQWSKAHPDATGDTAVTQVANESWDPSVQSLVAFPQVLELLGQKPDWVQNVGDAFLGAPERVMDRIQLLRKKAQDSGNLKTTEQQKVVVEPAAPAAAATTTTTIIKIEPAQPQVVYVPTYNPTYVYGSWWWPSPPVYIPPPPGSRFFSAVVRGIGFGIGLRIADSLWGDCDWHHHGININVHKYNNIHIHKKLDVNVNNVKWNHNAANRRGVPYRDNATREKFGKSKPATAASREAYRGRDDQRDAARQALQNRGVQPPARTPSQAVDRAREADRSLRNQPPPQPKVQPGSRDMRKSPSIQPRDTRNVPSVQPRDRGMAQRDNVFKGVRDAGATRSAIQRGTTSRSKPSAVGNRSAGSKSRR